MRKQFGWIACLAVWGAGFGGVEDARGQQPSSPTFPAACRVCGHPRRLAAGPYASAQQQAAPAGPGTRWCSCPTRPSPQVAPGASPQGGGPMGVPSGAPGAMPGGITNGPGVGPAGPMVPGAEAAPGAGAPGAGAGADAGAGGFGAAGAGAGGGEPALASGLGGGLGGSEGALVMLGDRGPALGIMPRLVSPLPPTPPTPGRPPTPGQPRSFLPEAANRAKTLIPYVRGLKIAENMSPIPQDRVFSGFNYYNNMNGALNGRFASPVSNIEVYRYLLGFEKTFFNGNASIGLRNSINVLSSSSRIPGLGGTSSSVGDLNLFAKFVLLRSGDLSNGPSLGPNGAGGPLAATGSGALISTGLGINTPTGPGNFAGSSFSTSYRNTQLAPFLGYYFKKDRLFVQGFEQISVPLDARDVVMLYTDIGVGYFLYRNNSPTAWITAIAPTFECHVNIPLNHRNYTSFKDPIGTQDVVDFTYGTNVLFGRRSLFTTGIVTPVTGPKPFDFEVVALFSFYFGGRRPTAPLIGN